MRKGDYVKVKDTGLKGIVCQVGKYGLVLIQYFGDGIRRAIYDPDELEVIG